MGWWSFQCLLHLTAISIPDKENKEQENKINNACRHPFTFIFLNLLPESEYSLPETFIFAGTL